MRGLATLTPAFSGLLYGALFVGVYLATTNIAFVREALIRPDPSHLHSATHADEAYSVAALDTEPPADGSPQRTSFKPHRVHKKLDTIDPDTDALIARADDPQPTSSGLEVDRHDPYNAEVMYPAVNMFTMPFDETSPFAASEANARRHAKRDRHASARPPKSTGTF